MRRRHKNLMDVLRLFCLYVVNLFANRKITDPTQLMPFDWDTPVEDEEPGLSEEEQERQLQALLDDCRRHNELLAANEPQNPNDFAGSFSG